MDPTASFRITATDETTAAIRSAAHNLHELERPIRDIRRLGEAVIGGFGFEKLLEGFDKVAKRAAKMGTDSAMSVVAAQRAIDDLGDSLGDLAVDLTAKVAPAIETAAKFWKGWLSDNTGADAQVRSLNERILELRKSLMSMPKDEFGAAPNAANPFLQSSKAAAAEKQLADLVEQRDALVNAPGPLSFDVAKMPLKKGLEDVNKTLDDINEGFKELDRNEQLLNEGDLKITVDKTEQLRQMPKFDPEADALAASLAAAKKEAKQFADAFTATFESRGIQALLDGDLSGAVKGLAKDFAELIIKLTVLKPLAESISSWLTASGGLGAIFGGTASAGAGAALGSAGNLLVTDSVAPGRGGMTINNYVAAGLPPQWDQSLGTAARIAATKAYQAMNDRMNGKR
jgi:hypothetical protein